MIERPILFSGPMVRALLAGTKTQTRRAVKGEPLRWLDGDGFTPEFVALPENALCPQGQPSDRLWVREAWRTVAEADALPPRDLNAAHRVWYEADAPHQPGFGRRRPSMFMPRWASRITLEINGVRVERLQAISRGDAMQEGCPFPNMAQGDDPRRWYSQLWDSINGAGSWDANPWVWCVEFRLVTP
jgi:hypothetical protein